MLIRLNTWARGTVPLVGSGGRAVGPWGRGAVGRWGGGAVGQRTSSASPASARVARSAAAGAQGPALVANLVIHTHAQSSFLKSNAIL